MKTTAAVIDFGTNKIVTVLAESGAFSRCEIRGTGTVPYAGFQKGEWIEPIELPGQIKQSIAAAELEAKASIKEIFVSVPADFLRIKLSDAEAPVAAEDGRITEDDMDAVHDAAADVLGLGVLGGSVVHRSPAWFSADGGKKTMTPIQSARKARTLRALTSFVIAEDSFVSQMRELFSGMQITIRGFVAPALGEAILYIPTEERDRTAALIDVGYLNTEISMIEGDAVISHAILGMGGGDITAALAYGLRISMREAEQIKRSYLFNPDEFDQDNFYEVDSDDGMRLAFPRHEVANIIENKTDELCDLINKTLNNDAIQHFGPRTQVHLTGGGLALMRGGREYLAAQMGKPVKVPVAKSAKLNSPVYASALGLVSLIFDSIEQPEHSGDSITKKLTGFFKKG